MVDNNGKYPLGFWCMMQQKTKGNCVHSYKNELEGNERLWERRKLAQFGIMSGFC